MATSLFRPEAVEFKRQRGRFGATAAPPLAAWIVTAFLATSVVAAGIFLSSGTYARKETVAGYLTPTAGIAKLMPSAPGVVTELYVHDGDVVRPGQPLLLVRTERHGAGGEAVDTLVVGSLKAKRAALVDRIEIERRSAEERQRSLTEVIAGLEAEVSTLSESLQTQRQRLQVAHDQVEAVRPTVAHGFTSMTEFRHRLDTELSQRQAETELYRQISAKAVEVREKRQALDEAAARSADAIATLQASLAEADSALAEAGSKRGYIISSPIAGRATSLQAHIGMSTEANVPLVSIVPGGGELEGALLVPPRAVGFVSPGQTVRVAFDPFPFQQFGMYGATITSISGNLLKPNETVGPISVTEPVYRLTARLDRQTVTAYGDAVPLRSGMSLKADIIVSRRSLIAWLFDPLLSASGRI
jgi:membrane fusion protein